MTSQPSTLHFCKSTSAWPAPRRPVRDNERIFQVATLSSPVRDRALVTFCRIFSLRRLSGRALLLPFLADLFFLYFMVGPSIQVQTLLVCLATEWVQQSRSASAASLIPSSVPNLLLTHARPSPNCSLSAEKVLTLQQAITFLDFFFSITEQRATLEKQNPCVYGKTYIWYTICTTVV